MFEAVCENCLSNQLVLFHHLEQIKQVKIAIKRDAKFFSGCSYFMPVGYTSLIPFSSTDTISGIGSIS